MERELMEIFDAIICSKVLDQLDRETWEQVMDAGRKLSNCIAFARNHDLVPIKEDRQ